jgi:hypothetical protein
VIGGRRTAGPNRSTGGYPCRDWASSCESRIPVTEEDEFQSPDIAAATELVASEALLGEVEKLAGGLA